MKIMAVIPSRSHIFKLSTDMPKTSWPREAKLKVSTAHIAIRVIKIEKGRFLGKHASTPAKIRPIGPMPPISAEPTVSMDTCPPNITNKIIAPIGIGKIKPVKKSQCLN